MVLVGKVVQRASHELDPSSRKHSEYFDITQDAQCERSRSKFLSQPSSRSTFTLSSSDPKPESTVPMTNPREILDHKVNGLNEAISIRAVDEPGAGGANHRYEIAIPLQQVPHDDLKESFTAINFQKGPIKEAGINGISNEALLAIVADRLKSFQAGEFSTKENAVALTHVESAMLWLHKRTNDRLRRGVEGTNQK
jgi:hypothetical protein